MTDLIVARLAQQVIAMANDRGQTLATAESCTGGLVSAALTDVPGASAVFTHGFVTYANAAKQAMINVRSQTLQSHGAVSRQVASEMAEGARIRSGADIAVAITGVAGPGGGTAAKPVGLVWFGLASAKPARADHRLFPGASRAQIRLLATRHALGLLRDALL